MYAPDAQNARPYDNVGLLAAGFVGWARAEEFVDEVGAAYAAEGACYVDAVGRVVPEEEFALLELLVGCGGGVYFFAGVWVVAGVVYFGGHCHGGWREVLDLLEVEVEFFCLGGELSHVFGAASGMR